MRPGPVELAWSFGTCGNAVVALCEAHVGTSVKDDVALAKLSKVVTYMEGQAKCAEGDAGGFTPDPRSMTIALQDLRSSVGMLSNHICEHFAGDISKCFDMLQVLVRQWAAANMESIGHERGNARSIFSGIDASKNAASSSSPTSPMSKTQALVVLGRLLEVWGTASKGIGLNLPVLWSWRM